MKPKVIAVVGPTASGKTKMAIDLALQNNGEVISADSRLVYKGFNIAAAKPTKEEMCGIPHHMIDIVEPYVDYSVGDYVKDAKKIIEEIISKGKTPIVAGGTGLYFRILLENYNLPEVKTDYEIRKKFDALEKQDLLEQLMKLDSITYERLKDSNKRRIVRALEMITILEKPLSELELTKEPEYDVEWRIPEMNSREELYEKINKRVDMMVKDGILDETKLLLEKYGRINNFTCTIGYQEMLAFLDGEWSFEEAIEKLKQHTRNYAKRQLTWFRRNPALKINI